MTQWTNNVFFLFLTIMYIKSIAKVSLQISNLKIKRKCLMYEFYLYWLQLKLFFSVGTALIPTFCLNPPLTSAQTEILETLIRTQFFCSWQHML